jgi:hypothetical protein
MGRRSLGGVRQYTSESVDKAVARMQVFIGICAPTGPGVRQYGRETDVQDYDDLADTMGSSNE